MAIAVLLIPFLLATPLPASGEVASIEDTKDKLEHISEEEHKVLEQLFLITKEMEALEVEQTKIANEMKALKEEISDLEASIDRAQKDYDSKLEVLQEVLVYYQRGGPATYLEILLNAESFSEFLKSLNVIKDISHNVSELLTSLEEGQILLKLQKEQLDNKVVMLENKQLELEQNMRERETARQEQETYLTGLNENRVYYEEQLSNLQLLWDDCKKLFTNIVSETTRIIGEGYFTAEDLNLGFGLFTMPGAIEEDTFNSVLNDNSDMTETFFHFRDGEVVLEVPELHLILQGNFVIEGDRAIRYEVTEGTFYELPLDELSMRILFEQGPFVIDFAAITNGIEIVDFTLQEVTSQEKRLSFVIKLNW
jgi:peptidoglycan hydrolase CwlO-like protein